MSKLPIEVCLLGKVKETEVNIAISIANSIQDQFVFERLDPISERRFQTLNFRTINTKQFFGQAKTIKDSLHGFHPSLILFVDSSLESEGWRNLFSARDNENRIAISTIKGVQKIIIPQTKMVSYFLYYLGRNSLNFIVPDHYNHDETRECVFDFMKNKKHILLSMKSGALCDECRNALSKASSLSADQLQALDKIFHASGNILKTKKTKTNQRLKIFIGSSVEGLKIAREIKRQLGNGYEIDVWDKDTVFGLGQATIESLEAAVNKYDVGVFVFTPDDELLSRKSKKTVARDNVIFESGLFIGKLTRFKAFIVQPSKNRVAVPSDLKGLTTAIFNPSQKPLANKVRSAVKKIRTALKNMEKEIAS
jgi:predicted nucleotide-binding protein